MIRSQCKHYRVLFYWLQPSKYPHPVAAALYLAYYLLPITLLPYYLFSILPINTKWGLQQLLAIICFRLTIETVETVKVKSPLLQMAAVTFR